MIDARNPPVVWSRFPGGGGGGGGLSTKESIILTKECEENTLGGFDLMATYRTIRTNTIG